MLSSHNPTDTRNIDLIGIGWESSAIIGVNILVSEAQKFQQEKANATNSGGKTSDTQSMDK